MVSLIAPSGRDSASAIEMPPLRPPHTRMGKAPFVNGESAYFLSINRNKRSLTLNLRTDKGKEVLRRLIERSDVVIENFRGGAMDRLGFGYERLREINPRVIYCAISGYGHTGPLRTLAGVRGNGGQGW